MTIDTKKNIGFRLRAARNAQKYTQPQLAEKVERTKETISNIERGITAPTIETLDRLSRVLNLPIREFFEDPAGNVVDLKRYRLELEIREMLRKLSSSELKIARKQVQALLNRED